MVKNNFLKVLSFFIFPALIFFFNLFLNSLNVYNVYSCLDIPMHFIGGVSVGYMSVLFLKFFGEKNLIEIKSKLIFVMVIVSSVALIAILWEFYEFAMVNYFGFDWNIDYEDTLGDLLFGILGGTFAGIIFRKI